MGCLGLTLPAQDEFAPGMVSPRLLQRLGVAASFKTFAQRSKDLMRRPQFGWV